MRDVSTPLRRVVARQVRACGLHGERVPHVPRFPQMTCCPSPATTHWIGACSDTIGLMWAHGVINLGPTTHALACTCRATGMRGGTPTPALRARQRHWYRCSCRDVDAVAHAVMLSMEMHARHHACRAGWAGPHASWVNAHRDRVHSLRNIRERSQVTRQAPPAPTPGAWDISTSTPPRCAAAAPSAPVNQEWHLRHNSKLHAF